MITACDGCGRRHAVARYRGYAAVMAMVFLVIGTSLVAGLYAMVASATAITGNEQRVAQALSAAETGMAIMRRQLSIAATLAPFPGINSSQWIGPLATAMGQTMSGTATLGGTSLAAPVSFRLTVPSILLGDGTSFSALIEPTSDNRRLSLTVTGYSTGDVSRRLQVEFDGPPVVFPLAARQGIPSANNINLTGQKGLTYAPTPVSLTDGTTAAVLLYPGMAAPSPAMDFPNNDALIQAVAGLGLKPITDSSTRTPQTATTAAAQNSCSIPPNTNPTLSGIINGIIYVQWPNNVTVGDSLLINGTIVFERRPSQTSVPSTLQTPQSATVDRSMADASATMQQFSATLANELKWWSIIAPDTDFILKNGSTWGTSKTFEGSLHIRSFSRQGGGDQLAFQVTRGGIIAEATIDSGSNSGLYSINSDTSGIGDRLTLVTTSYQELMH